MATRDGKPEPTPTEKFWARTIESWKSKSKDLRQRYERAAKTYRSDYWTDNRDPEEADESRTETNYFYAFADTLIAQVVPLNPAVTIEANRQSLKDPAKYRTALVNTIFRKEKMADKLWKAATRASVWPRSWIKVVWSKSRERPTFRVINPHFVWFDTTAEEYEDIRYIIEVTVLSRAEFNRRVKVRGSRTPQFYREDALEDKTIQFGQWPKWLKPDVDNDGDMDSTRPKEMDIVRDEYEWTVVYEVYDFRGKKFYHYAEGCERPLLTADLPYKHVPNPFLCLTFNDNLQDLGGMSDAELISKLVDRKNEMDSLELWHTRTSIPATVFHGGLVDDPDEFMDAVEAIDGPGQVVELNARQGVGVDQVLGQTPVTQLPIEWSRVEERLDKNIQFVLGMPSYARGELGQSDVATELALSDTATRTRNARRQKVIYHALEWAAKSVIGLYQEFMPEDEALPLRVDDDLPAQEVTRELLQFGEENPRDPWAFDYDVHPYSAEEANSVVQLKQLEGFLPVFLQGVAAGVVDPKKLFEKLAELLKMPDLITEAPPPGAAQALAPQPGGMPAPGGAPMPGNMPPEMAAMAGGQVPVGTGDQAIPGGMEGGYQPGAGGPGRPPMAGTPGSGGV